MTSSLEKLSSLERKLNIVVPAAEVQAAFAKAFQGIQPHAVVKGFRKGKAPLSAVKKFFGDRVKQDVIENIVQTHYASALDEHSLDPISYPTIEFDQIDENANFSFSAEFEVRPEVKLAQWEHLPVKKEKLEMPPGFIDATLEDLRRSRADMVPIFEERPAQNGDIAVIDFAGMLLDGPLENGSAENHPLELGSNSFIPGFEEAIVGMRLGEVRDVPLTFPEAYQGGLGGKPVTFKVTLKELKKKSLPELNDEFAKSLGGPAQTLDELKKAIHDDYEQREQRRIAEDLKNRLMRVLVDRNPVEVPKTLLNEQKKALVEDFKKRMAQQGMNEEQFDDYKGKWDADFEQTASFMIQSSFLIDAVAREYKLFATAEDVEKKMIEYASQTGIDLARVRDFYNEKDRKGRLAFQISEEKVVDFLTSKADLKEVPRAELEAERQADGPMADAHAP